MTMKSQFNVSDLYSCYGLSQISKWHFTGSSEKLKTMRTRLERLKLTPEKNPRKIRDPLMFRKIFFPEKPKQQQQCHYFGPTNLFWNSFAGINNFYTSKKGVTVVCQEKLYCTPKKVTVNLWRFRKGAFREFSRQKKWGYNLIFAENCGSFFFCPSHTLLNFNSNWI